MRRLLLIGTLLLAQRAVCGERIPLLPAPDTPIEEQTTFDPFNLVSVCPFRDSWAVMWHVPPGTDRKKGDRASFELNVGRFNECLTLIISSDPDTAKLVTTALKSIDRSTVPATIDMDAFEASTIAVKTRWASFGVGEAITEVAETGQRGKKVEHVLAECEKLRQVPKGESR